jgi:hypothetical protein
VAKKINSCLNYAFKFKIIAEIIASTNSADEVNSIVSIRTTFVEEMNENPALEAGKKSSDEYER